MLEKVVRWAERKIATEKNLERFVKYYWIVSTFRLVLGLTIMMFILLLGYKFGDLVPFK